MKTTPRIHQTLWLQLFALTLPIVAQAQFTYTTNNGTITITGYTGPGGSVTIPDTIAGLPVDNIGAGAFSRQTNVTAVTIPNSVTAIWAGAFQDCSHLTSIQIPDSVTRIDEGAFRNCTSLTALTLPNSITYLGYSVLGFCTNLGAVSFGSGLVEIPTWALYGCTSLTNVWIPQGITRIRAGAFEGCNRLSQITIPNSITEMGGMMGVDPPVLGAFLGCANLARVYFEGSPPGIIEGMCGQIMVVPEFCACPVTVFYLPGSAGWGPTFGGRPTALWLPELQAIAPDLGQPFGSTISWARDKVVVIEATTDLSQPAWIPLSTNTLAGGLSTFSDPKWTNYPTRIYRARTP